MTDKSDPVDKVVTLKRVLYEDRRVIAGLLLIGSSVAYFLGVDFALPRWVKLFGLALLLGMMLGYVPASKIVEWLYSPNFTYLIDVDARDAEFAVYQLPPEVWRDLNVVEGELYEVRAAVPAWECRSYAPPDESVTYKTTNGDGEPMAIELEDNQVVGTWRGSASDLELIQERERIDEVRGILEDLAQEGLSIRVKQSGIIRSAVRGIVMSFVEGFESETLYKGDEVKKSVDKALSRWSVDGSDIDKHEERYDDDTKVEGVGDMSNGEVDETVSKENPAADGGVDR